MLTGSVFTPVVGVLSTNCADTDNGRVSVIIAPTKSFLIAPKLIRFRSIYGVCLFPAFMALLPVMVFIGIRCLALGVFYLFQAPKAVIVVIGSSARRVDVTAYAEKWSIGVGIHKSSSG